MYEKIWERTTYEKIWERTTYEKIWERTAYEKIWERTTYKKIWERTMWENNVGGSGPCVTHLHSGHGEVRQRNLHLGHGQVEPRGLRDTEGHQGHVHLQGVLGGVQHAVDAVGGGAGGQSHHVTWLERPLGAAGGSPHQRAAAGGGVVDGQTHEVEAHGVVEVAAPAVVPLVHHLDGRLRGTQHQGTAVGQAGAREAQGVHVAVPAGQRPVPRSTHLRGWESGSHRVEQVSQIWGCGDF